MSFNIYFYLLATLLTVCPQKIKVCYQLLNLTLLQSFKKNSSDENKKQKTNVLSILWKLMECKGITLLFPFKKKKKERIYSNNKWNSYRFVMGGQIHLLITECSSIKTSALVAWYNYDYITVHRKQVLNVLSLKRCLHTFSTDQESSYPSNDEAL